MNESLCEEEIESIFQVERGRWKQEEGLGGGKMYKETTGIGASQG